MRKVFPVIGFGNEKNLDAVIDLGKEDSFNNAIGLMSYAKL